MELKLENITKFYGKQCALDNFNGVLRKAYMDCWDPTGGKNYADKYNYWGFGGQ